MSTELYLVGWILLLAIVQILLASYARNKETGTAYNVGPRDDEGPPVGRLTARLRRAQANLFETMPVIVAALIVAHVTGREGVLTLSAAILYLVARIVYLPLYAAGIPVLRSVVWLVSLVGVLMAILAILLP
ncbi:Uncharacterized conserved protein, MAPEG superfamily [Arboricoccus pini]|uniref:Uncharacterized conserved protein, MAPEG superfamily n=1 Tax=Arboricoccus pini TaxID=1963835 RepID=A0A212R835_9PROT|nr:MAPEG family protein [Arboricoccus pini]SNB68140.1 Uncharacterized conserved protein, MAPEG superfamily [Arboricoccus pini]